MLSLNGTDITEDNSVGEILLPLNPDDEVSVTVLRGDDETELTMTLGQLPEGFFEERCAVQGTP